MSSPVSRAFVALRLLDKKYGPYRTMSEADRHRWHHAMDTLDADDARRWERTRRFLSVYTVDRCYGGPEEGGWYYDAYTYICSACVDKSSPARRGRVKARLETQHAHLAWGNISSVLGGEEVRVLYEEHPREHETRERPHYE